MLDLGSFAPNVDVCAADGRRVQIPSPSRRMTVVFFYPKAFDRLCTRELSCFRESHADILARGADVVGVSTDVPEVQCRFADATRAPFPLIADPTGTITRAWRVHWPLLGRARRVTYVVDADGDVVFRAWHELFVSQHVDDLVAFLSHASRERTADAANATSL